MLFLLEPEVRLEQRVQPHPSPMQTSREAPPEPPEDLFELLVQREVESIEPMPAKRL